MLGLVLLVPAAAFAQDGASPQAAEAAEAFNRGITAMQARQFNEAVVAFQDSYRLRAVPTVLYNLALSYRSLGQNLEAIETFQRYLHDGGASIPDARVAAIRETLVALRAAVGVVTLHVEPEGALVTVDGRPALFGPAGSDLLLDPGERVIHVEAPGYASQQRMIRIGAGQSQTLAVALVAVASAPVTVPFEASAVPWSPSAACVPGAQVQCGCAGGTVGVQRCNAVGSGFEACVCAPTHERYWYGWQTLIVDGASLAVAGVGFGTGNTPTITVGELAYTFGAPIVHWTHGNVGFGFASLGLRIAGELTTDLGALLAPSGSGVTVSAILGGVIELTAIVLDASVFGRGERPVRTTAANAVFWAPTAMVTPRGGLAGVVASF